MRPHATTAPARLRSTKAAVDPGDILAAFNIPDTCTYTRPENE